MAKRDFKKDNHWTFVRKLIAVFTDEKAVGELTTDIETELLWRERRSGQQGTKALLYQGIKKLEESLREPVLPGN